MLSNAIEKAWYKSPTWLWLLWPFTLVFVVISSLRRKAYCLGIKRQTRVNVPIVVVGNISVGGNGKTPMVVFLVEWLRENGFRPGVLSRGYGGHATDFPQQVTSQSIAAEVGDEPLLIATRLACPVVIDPVRARGANFLCEQCNVDVIVCDDGMQHYALARDIEIAVIDGSRRFGNGWRLPMGPLREGLTRLQDVDFIVNNGGPVHTGEHLMTLIPSDAKNLITGESRPLSEFNHPVAALAGIGNPSRFFTLLKTNSVPLLEECAFPDHHEFSESDLPKSTVLMTEKDAVKCQRFAHDDCWYIPVDASLPVSFVNQFAAKLATFHY